MSEQEGSKSPPSESKDTSISTETTSSSTVEGKLDKKSDSHQFDSQEFRHAKSIWAHRPLKIPTEPLFGPARSSEESSSDDDLPGRSSRRDTFAAPLSAVSSDSFVAPNSRSRSNSRCSASYSRRGSVSSTRSGGLHALSYSRRGSVSATRSGGVHALDLEDALAPDTCFEEDFVVDNNPFAFSPGQLAKLYHPKSLAAFCAIGGLSGLERGLRTDRNAGLGVDEQRLDGKVSFEEATETSTWFFTRAHFDGNGHSVSGTDCTSYASRRRVFGTNLLPETKSSTILKRIWVAYDSVFILLSLAAVTSLAIGLYQASRPPPKPSGSKFEWIDSASSLVTAVIVVLVTAVNGWIMERRLLDLRKKREDRMIKVIRSGRILHISVHDALVGEVILLEPGDMIPADGILIEGHDVECDESTITGESDLLKKTPANKAYGAILGGVGSRKPDPFILSGAKVTGGLGSFLCTGTGIHSGYGKLMMSLSEYKPANPSPGDIITLAEKIAKIGICAALGMFAVLLIRYCVGLPDHKGAPLEKGQEFLKFFIESLALVVVAVPEGLPLVLPFTLASCNKRMMQDNVLVQHLDSCETMGKVTAVCVGKSTLTEKERIVSAGLLGSHVGLDGCSVMLSSDEGGNNGKGPDGSEKYHPPDDILLDNGSTSKLIASLDCDVKELLKDSIVLNSLAFETDGPPLIGSMTETALLTFACVSFGTTSPGTERSNADIVHIVPFDPSKRYSAVVIRLETGSYRMYVKGTPEILLSKCDRVLENPTRGLSTTTFSTRERVVTNEIIVSPASRSLQKIAFAYRDLETWPPLSLDASKTPFERAFQCMTYVGVLGLQNSMMEGVHAAVHDLNQAGVVVRMVTGDDLTVAKYIAACAGISVPGSIQVTTRGRSIQDSRTEIPRLSVLAQCTPEDKRFLIHELKELGETVAATGRHADDMPMLKTADVGISMGMAGTAAVAKDAAGIILMDDNLRTLVKAILWGRTVNNSVKRFSQYHLTICLSTVLLVLVSAVASPNQQPVLTAPQLLWVKLIVDQFAALALATDGPTEALLKRGPDPKNEPVVNLTMWKMSVGQAIYQLAVTYTLHFGGRRILPFGDEGTSRSLPTLVFNTLIWMNIANLLNSRRVDNRFDVFEGIRSSPRYIMTTLVMAGAQITIIFVGNSAFSVQPLNGWQWGVSLVFGAITIPVGMIIRCIPDRFVSFMMWARPPPSVQVDENRDLPVEWDPGNEVPQREPAFIRRVKGRGYFG